MTISAGARRNCGGIFERSEEHTSELQSLRHLVCRLLLEKKKPKSPTTTCTCALAGKIMTRHMKVPVTRIASENLSREPLELLVVLGKNARHLHIRMHILM